MVWSYWNPCHHFSSSDKQKTKTARVRLYPSSIAHHKSICRLGCCNALVLVEYHNTGLGAVALYRTNDALEIIKWGQRLLFGMLILSFFIVYGYFHVLITFTFLGSVVCLTVPAILYLEAEIKDMEDKSLVHVHKCTLELTSEYSTNEH